MQRLERARCTKNSVGASTKVHFKPGIVYTILVQVVQLFGVVCLHQVEYSIGDNFLALYKWVTRFTTLHITFLAQAVDFIQLYWCRATHFVVVALHVADDEKAKSHILQ